MAQHKSAEKRARSTKRRAAQNAQWKSRMRNAVKRVREAKDKEKVWKNWERIKGREAKAEGRRPS